MDFLLLQAISMANTAVRIVDLGVLRVEPSDFLIALKFEAKVAQFLGDPTPVERVIFERTR